MTTMRLHPLVEGVDISSILYRMVQRIEKAAIKVQKTLSTWASRAEDRRQLATMSDHLLTDIGLSRTQVIIETNKFFWQR